METFKLAILVCLLVSYGENARDEKTVNTKNRDLGNSASVRGKKKSVGRQIITALKSMIVTKANKTKQEQTWGGRMNNIR